MFIKLTKEYGDAVYIKANHIEALQTFEKTTMISCTNSTFFVKETIEEILTLIEGGSHYGNERNQ